MHNSNFQRSSLWASILGLLTVIAVVSVNLASGINSGNQVHGENTIKPQDTPSARIVLGIPAIHPSINIGADAPPSIFAITQNDVKAYVTTHPLFRNTIATKISISKIIFTNESNLYSLVGEGTGLLSTAAVCYVEVMGNFQFPVPSGASPVVFNKGFEVFDGQTGNLVLAGGRP
jgi:hypothetical protein